MSTQALVQIDPAQALMVGGVGLDNDLFKLRPATIECVQKTTRQEGAIPGKLRITATNEHFDEMQVAMLFPPVEQRAYFEGEEFSKESKLCFSLDNLKPHDKAAIPQAMACGFYNAKGQYITQCPKADWAKYRQSKKREDMPKCRNYYHLILADRATQMPYYANVRGTSIEPFKMAMQNVARLIAKMQAAGQKPNIFDISFKIFPVPQTTKKGVYYIYGFKDFAPIAIDDRAKFGDLFLDFAARRAQGLVQDAATSEEAATAADTASVEASVAEAPAGPLQGTVVGKDEVITI
jgi:hypothetical protein